LLARLWWDIARDETRRDSDRLEASKLLADRGWARRRHMSRRSVIRSTWPRWRGGGSSGRSSSCSLPPRTTGG